MKKHCHRPRWVGAVFGAAAVLALEGLALAAPRTFPPVNDAAYLKECGACHMAFPPQLLPARSWQRVMGALDSHFGEPARIDTATHAKIAQYLAANGAESVTNAESIAVLASLQASEAPERITKVPYIEGLHVAVLDPRWNGTPRPKTLASCPACHYRAEAGDFFERRFKVSDEAFRK